MKKTIYFIVVSTTFFILGMTCMAYLAKDASAEFFNTIILNEIDKHDQSAQKAIKNKDYLTASFHFHSITSLTRSLRNYYNENPIKWALDYPFIALALRDIMDEQTKDQEKGHDAMNHIVLGRTLELNGNIEKAGTEYKKGMELLEIKDKNVAIKLADTYLKEQK